MALTGLIGGCPPENLLSEIDCPDPAVTNLQVEVLEKSGSTGTIRVTGTVTNVGLQTFDSSPGQQSIRMTRGNTQVATQAFEDLAPGESLSISVEAEWDRLSEFLVGYTVRITYDPDIFIDANEENDDCRTANNSRTISVEEINEAFDAAP
jgi:hypothetical protein